MLHRVRLNWLFVCTVPLLWVATPQAIENTGEQTNVRTSNPRIREVYREMRRRSESFEDLIATLDQLDRVVYLEEGRCRDAGVRSCLEMLPQRTDGTLVVRLDPRQSVLSVVEQLAHELYHAVEIAREPSVRDNASMRELFGRIGEQACSPNEGIFPRT